MIKYLKIRCVLSTIMTSVHNNQTYIHRCHEYSIPAGYKLSNQMRVFPPMSERPSVVREIAEREGKPPSKTTQAVADMWQKVTDFVEKNNALPSKESGDAEQTEMHTFLLSSPSPDSRQRIYYIQQDGVAPWYPVYGEVAGLQAAKGIRGYVNTRTGQTVVATKDTVQPPPILYDCLVSSAEMATNVKPIKMATSIKTTENKPGQGK